MSQINVGPRHKVPLERRECKWAGCSAGPPAVGIEYRRLADFHVGHRGSMRRRCFRRIGDSGGPGGLRKTEQPSRTQRAGSHWRTPSEGGRIGQARESGATDGAWPRNTAAPAERYPVNAGLPALCKGGLAHGSPITTGECRARTPAHSPLPRFAFFFAGRARRVGRLSRGAACIASRAPRTNARICSGEASAYSASQSTSRSSARARARGSSTIKSRPAAQKRVTQWPAKRASS
jgi:hypothetical protein